MNKILSQRVTVLDKVRKNKKIWLRVVTGLIALVVFCTVYALILPAITMAKRPICGIEVHTHSDECYETSVTDTGLTQRTKICTLQEHIHKDSCYPLEETDESKSDYLCGSSEHTHTEDCYDESNVIMCNVPEHIHNASCLVEDLDLNADIEKADYRQAQIDKLGLTGNFPYDVMLIAKNQLGYTESTKNCVLTNDNLKGYTRYGAWYGASYAEWNTLFVGFCLDYAGVENFPFNHNIEEWKTQLQQDGYYYNASDYSPKVSDIVFIGNEVGLVNEVIPATETTPSQINVIIGDRDNTVVSVTYEMSNSDILGYASLPECDKRLLTYSGTDYTVIVSFGEEANIPENATLAVQEILSDTEEYKSYYNKSVEELQRKSGTKDDKELDVSFARFFDISFIADGKTIEPDSSVDVQINYQNKIKIEELERAVAVHFADDGIEVLDVETSKNQEAQQNEVDTLKFTQDSFSVVGTVVSNYSASFEIKSATTIDFNALSTSSGTQYVLYTQYNGKYYAITSKSGDKQGYSIPITVNSDGTISWENSDTSIFWTFTSNGGNTYYVQNVDSARYLHAFDNSSPSYADYGTTTMGRNYATLTRQWDGSFIAQGNRQYTGVSIGSNGSIGFNRVGDQSQAARFYLARVDEVYNIWFDGTNGGMMSYYGADNLNLPVLKKSDNSPVTITLPETWKSSTKYDYTLQGWYDINSNIYYPVNPDDGMEVTAQISADTVFYADWIASTYDVGQNNSNVVDSLDTNDFITTHVFDYNVLFNVQSLTHTGTISSASHTENWSIVNNGKVPYNNADTLGFAFVDYDSDGEFSYPRGRDNTNVNQGDAITSGIINEVKNASGKDLIDILFNPDTNVIGKKYVGTGNYLFQYMDSTTANYDGQHDGYYYLDARRNAASYNQTDKRFYLYNYLERTSDSTKDGGIGEYSDFLPFNSPYLFDESQLDGYVDRIMTPGYEYDAKDGETSFKEYNSVDDATTNYFFGFSSNIEFFLPNDAGSQDEYGNYGNISTHGDHMIFDFHGDDDVWVMIDGELVLDIGGLHGVMFGQIDFSTGTVTSGKDGGITTTKTFEQILGKNITEGTHYITIHYMERGSSQSNCAIYFNVAPRYELQLEKEDIVTAEKLVDAEFTVYTCENCANGNCQNQDHTTPQLAQLWDSKQAYNEDMNDGKVDNSKSTFVVGADGKLYCWGISAGKTYYIKETKPPEGYPTSDDLIRITLNNRGTASIETTTLNGANGIATEGFAVISQEVDNILQVVKFSVSNQKEGETTEVRVEKAWAEGSENIPNDITVYLTADGKPVGRTAKLHEGNGWSYKWKGLPKYSTDGTDEEIVYEVEEVLVPNYRTIQGKIQKVENYLNWTPVDQMSDSETYILVHNGQALTYDWNGFGWMPFNLEDKENLNTNSSAHWNVTTDHDGFHLKNELGYTLTFDSGNNSFYCVNDDDNSLNQVAYYLNSRLLFRDHDVYYQFSENGTAVTEDGLAFKLYQKEVLTGYLTGITNVPLDEEEQTYVEVTKVWDDGEEQHTTDSVTFSLYFDGKDTGRDLVLNSENSWKGGFYDLPYYKSDGVTVIEYTVKEDEAVGYAPFYSEPVSLEPLPVDVWVNTTNIALNNIYRFTSGTYALVVNDRNEVTSELKDLTDNYQQWIIKSRDNGTFVMQNQGSGQYLAFSGTTLYMTDNIWTATNVSVNNGKVTLGGWMYLEISTNYAGATYNSANITNQNISVMVKTQGMNGVGFTVKNVPYTYRLPNTGGIGTLILTFGGCFIIIPVVMCIIKVSQKRKRGGKPV